MNGLSWVLVFLGALIILVVGVEMGNTTMIASVIVPIVLISVFLQVLHGKSG